MPSSTNNNAGSWDGYYNGQDTRPVVQNNNDNHARQARPPFDHSRRQTREDRARDAIRDYDYTMSSRGQRGSSGH